MLFEKPLSEGYLPNIWKTSFITPVYKSDNRSNVKNYRPISIMSIIPKLFEKIITKKLTYICKNIIIEEQHGFREKRSTETNLLIIQNYLIDKIESNSQVDVIYTDFAKAFDTVSHIILLQKLKCLGIHGIFLEWIKNYLTNRKQKVRYKSFISIDINVSSGVPQGSHLGPLLFLLFINDIIFQLLNCKFLLFADDLKIYLEIKSIEDCIIFQECLDLLLEWSNANKLYFNPKKCKVMRYTKTRNIIFLIINFTIKH